ncbi:hypothetical protein GCM10029992_31750 [Glycomyces albus]
MGQDLLVAQGPRGGPAPAQAAPLQLADLFDQPGLPHRLHASLDALVQDRGVEVDADADGIDAGLGFGEAGGERSGQLDHFEGSDDAAAVGGQDRLRGGRVGGPQAFPQGRRALALQFGLEAGSEGRVGAGEVHLVQGGLHVEPGAADQDGSPPAGADVGDGLAGELLVSGDVGGLGHVEDVEDVVGHSAPFGLGDLGGPDVHSPVQLHRIGVDHLS